jgi:nucleoside-diphosphate-sugar epimerase
MKLLVFGANGFIGQRVVARLLADGHQVTGYVRSDRAAGDVRALGAEAVVGALDDIEPTGAALAAHDGAIWIAQLMLDEEKATVLRFLKSYKSSGKTFIFTSGTSVLSQKTDGGWIENTFAETDSFLPRRELATRHETENIVRVASHTGVRAMVIRPPLVIGHGGCKVISDLYHSARKTGSVCYVGKGRNVYSYVHVDDLARVFSLAIERGRAGALYHCVAGETSFRDIAQTIAQRLGVSARSVTVAEAVEIWDRFTGTTVYSSCSRSRSPVARMELGWTADPDSPGILEECVDDAYVAEQNRSVPSWVGATS